MITRLSTRAFKFLHKISRKAGLENSDEEIHDMGLRLLGLCDIAIEAQNSATKNHDNLLTEPERKALCTLREQYVATGRLASARELSKTLGYRSSRSGHLLLHSLLSKRVLVRQAGRLNFAE